MAPSADDRRLGGVQVIHRAAQILNSIKDHPNGLSLSRISEEVGLPRSTVQRIVTALESEGLLMVASPAGGFRLGPALASLGVRAHRDLAGVLHGFLVELAEELNETVDLAVLTNDHVRFVDQVESPQRLKAVSAIGVEFPAYCTANGKALLAALPTKRVMQLLPPKLHRFTPATTTDRAALLNELQEVRLKGIAFDREEHTVGICAVGTVVEIVGQVPAAISVPLPASRFYGQERQLADALFSLRGKVIGHLEEQQSGVLKTAAGRTTPRSR